MQIRARFIKCASCKKSDPRLPELGGIAGPLLSGWLLQTTGSYTAPMEAVLFFLVLDAGACIVLLREQWVPTVRV